MSILAVPIDPKMHKASIGGRFQRPLRLRRTFGVVLWDRDLAISIHRDRAILSAVYTMPVSRCVGCVRIFWIFRRALMLSCGHVYCGKCIKRICATAVQTSPKRPAQCCNEVFSTVFVRSVLSVREYTAYTSALSRNQSQTALSLPHDPDYTIAVACIGGMICPRCGVGIVKRGGCNYIVCRCGHGFCYTGR